MSDVQPGWTPSGSNADRFAAEWEDAWNAHDIERLLAHFHDDVVFRSPVAHRVVAGSDGVVRGKAALRGYWSKALEQIPDLYFVVTAVFVGIETIVIEYRNQKGIDVAEVLVFDGPLIVAGMGTYPPAVLNPAGLDHRS